MVSHVSSLPFNAIPMFLRHNAPLLAFFFFPLERRRRRLGAMVLTESGLEHIARHEKPGQNTACFFWGTKRPFFFLNQRSIWKIGGWCFGQEGDLRQPRYKPGKYTPLDLLLNPYWFRLAEERHSFFMRAATCFCMAPLQNGPVKNADERSNLRCPSL